MCRWGIRLSRMVGEKRVARYNDPNVSPFPSIEEPKPDEAYKYQSADHHCGSNYGSVVFGGACRWSVRLIRSDL